MVQSIFYLMLIFSNKMAENSNYVDNAIWAIAFEK